MPPYSWITPPSEGAVQALRAPDREAEALASWAAKVVDELHYLKDIEERLPVRTLGHHMDVVDSAHARWATAGAVTALDLCAAALGRHYRLRKGTNELDLAQLAKPALKQALPPVPQAWVDEVWNDAEYQLILSARHSLVHRRLKRDLYAGSGAPTEIWIEQGGHEVRVSIPAVIGTAAELATRHVETFLADAKAGRL